MRSIVQNLTDQVTKVITLTLTCILLTEFGADMIAVSSKYVVMEIVGDIFD